MAIFHSWIGGIHLRQMRWWCDADLGSRCVWSSANIPFCRNLLCLSMTGTPLKMLSVSVPAFVMTRSLPTYERVWARLSNDCKAVGGVFVWIVPRRILQHNQDLGKETEERSSSQSVTLKSLSQSAQSFHRGCSLTGCQSVCFTLRKQQQLQTIYYPPLYPPIKKKKTEPIPHLKNDKVPAAAITAHLCCILIRMANVFLLVISIHDPVWNKIIMKGSFCQAVEFISFQLCPGI